MTNREQEKEKEAQRIERRRASVPAITYPDLPITQRRDDLLAAIRDHQVVIVAGDTGSGKSTQLPKLCLELGRGVNAMIGHTQPRRLAARTIAERIAEELNVSLGSAVGYAVRFNDQVSQDTLLKVMTDGILLAEIQRDRLLRRYDTIIIDEAHERSLNIDFLLGYLTQLLPQRPDLKVIVTSATIDTERFSEHFATVTPTPIIQVSGRTFPVEVRYRPFGPAAVSSGSEREADDRDQVQAISDAVEELCLAGPGDILVFLSGEREIRDAEEGLRAIAQQRNIDLMPLYARLTSTEQHRVFQPHTRRRVVLSTNVAETSLTVPGIRYVIDVGTARISRYNRRLKVQRLPIEAISQASANQRSGRCGRVAPGIAIRLYPDDDFDVRAEFTEPEILRTNLASVMLQMAALRLGSIAEFPFVEPPDSRSIRDGVDLLQELGAFDSDGQLTRLGRRLARLPLDPRLGRMILEAERLGCVRDVLVISAALSIQDPRERPTENRETAEAMHRRFANEHSDFVALLNLWTYLKEQQQERSSSQFRKMCKAEHLNHLRVREWQDIVSQLRQVLVDLDIKLDATGAHHDKIHQALLSGLLSHVGSRDEAERTQPKPVKGREPRRPRAEFVGVRNARFTIAPGSSLSTRGGRWVMVGELVETNRLWGRVAARIQPEWIEQLAPHLCTRSHSEPRWEVTRASAVVTERVMMRGLTIVAGRTVQLSRVDPVLAREMFIRHALVEGEWTTTHEFVKANSSLIDELRGVAERSRRSDLMASDDDLFAFFDTRIPADIASGPQFDRWWKRRSTTDPKLFNFTKELLLGADADIIATDQFPERWESDDLSLRLSYVFDGMDQADGLTVHVPLTILNRLQADEFGWHVPGFRRDLVTELIRSLPKTLRRQLVPAVEYADQFLQRVEQPAGSLGGRMADALGHLVGAHILPSDFRINEVPPHLRPTFSVEDGALVVGVGKDLRVLQSDLRDLARNALAETFRELERSDVLVWDFGELPKVVEKERGGSIVRGFPALVDEAGRVAVRVLTTEVAQEHSMWEGTTRLVLLNSADVAKSLRKALSARPKVGLALARHGDQNGMFEDCFEATVEHLVIVKGGPAWNGVEFDTLRRRIAADATSTALKALGDAAEILKRHDEILDRLARRTATAYDDVVVDMQQQIERLVPNSFVRVHGIGRLPQIVRYLTAMDMRIDKLVGAFEKDREKMRRIQVLDRECESTAPRVRARVMWMLEELRVSVFAQSLGTPEPVSEERIRRELRKTER